MSFLKSAGQSNYASGCTFKDAFASQLAKEWPCTVRLINWGYWGSFGVVNSEVYKERMARAGMDSIEPPEAMETLDTLLAGPFDQVALVKITKPTAIKHMSQEEWVEYYQEPFPSTIKKVEKRMLEKIALNTFIPNENSNSSTKMHRFLCELLLKQLQSLMLFEEGSLRLSKVKLNPIYNRWLEESLTVLAQNNYLNRDKDSFVIIDKNTKESSLLWAEWDQHKVEWLKDDNKKPYVLLVEQTLRCLPAILKGEQLPTDTLFPDGSMELVEKIYKHNPIADFFNEILADSILSHIEERLTQDASTKIKILEIGAGTGGTSATVFRKLYESQLDKKVQEYCYTDLSQAFLRHAEEQYAPQSPYLKGKIFNVEQSPEQQDFHLGSYNIVIATNVLHATRNIRQTLRNAKALLCNNGCLLINELSQNTLFHHLTFGLLEGWWLYEDQEIRIPGSPLLSPKIGKLF